jgi:hypothetical protein
VTAGSPDHKHLAARYGGEEFAVLLVDPPFLGGGIEAGDRAVGDGGGLLQPDRLVAGGVDGPGGSVVVGADAPDLVPGL